MKNNDNKFEWFDIAKMDLESAKYLCGMQPLPKEIICYHCQQTVEKMLKGFIAINGGEIIKTHDLIALNKRCIEYHTDFNHIMDLCIELVDYCVNVRYPYHLEITNEDTNIAIQSAERVWGL